MTTGLHHVTALTHDVQAHVDFYGGFLGLRLVKRTAGFEDAEQLHLFWGDAAGSPGSLLSFLVWQDGGRGRVGLGQVSEVALAVPPHSIGDWLTRALTAHVPVEGPARELGETVLRLKDPDGMIVKLVGIDLPATAPLPDPIAPTRLRGVTVLTAEAAAGRQMLEGFGYRAGVEEGAILRMVSDTDVVDLRAVAGYAPGIPGAGTVDHLALRAPDEAAVRALRDSLPADAGEVNMHDRRYFFSLYIRDKGEVLYEYASDGPGFGLDEPPETLGQKLHLPPGDAERAHDLVVMLPQFALPGAPRPPRRKLLFTYRLHEPEVAGENTFILLHGTGGIETSLLPFAHRLDPHARLIGLRGRATEGETLRWFRRLADGSFDQQDIRAEAEAFAAFLPDLAGLHDFDAAKAVFIGQSNGANFLGAAMRLCPGTIRRAVLLRGQEVLEPSPTVTAEGEALILGGAQDSLVGGGGQALAAALSAAGITVTQAQVAAGHDLVPADLDAAKGWLGL